MRPVSFLFLLFLPAPCHPEKDSGGDPSVPRDSSALEDTSIPADTSVAPPPCASPTDILTGSGEPTGFVRCADGSIDRVQVVPIVLGEDAEPYDPCMTDAVQPTPCMEDADCTAMTHGYCVGAYRSLSYSCWCDYLCSTDEECGTERACIPAEVWGADPHRRPLCEPALCSTDSDCPSGECGLAHDGSLACRTPADVCRADADCTENSYFCLPQANGAWACSYVYEGDPG